MQALIYRPIKSSLQSGKARQKSWALEFEPQKPRRIDPLTGNTGSGDMMQEVKLAFETMEEAITYAKNNRIAYRIKKTLPVEFRRMSYADNFNHKRKTSWSH